MLRQRRIGWILKLSGMSPLLQNLNLRMLISRMALAQFGTRFKIGFHHAQLIEYFFDRASNPTIEKLSAHYPEHPRPGAPELGPNADLGKCIINALNIKRGYWRLPRVSNSGQAASGISPFDTTPESSGSGSGYGSSNQHVNQAQPNLTGRWSEDSSPSGANNPFITFIHNQGPATSGFGSSTLLNPYLNAIGGNLDAEEMKSMAQIGGSGDGFGSGSKDFAGTCSWYSADGSHDKAVDLQRGAEREGTN